MTLRLLCASIGNGQAFTRYMRYLVGRIALQVFDKRCTDEEVWRKVEDNANIKGKPASQRRTYKFLIFIT